MNEGCASKVYGALEVLKQRQAELMDGASARDRQKVSCKRRLAQKLVSICTSNMIEVLLNL